MYLYIIHNYSAPAVYTHREEWHKTQNNPCSHDFVHVDECVCLCYVCVVVGSLSVTELCTAILLLFFMRVFNRNTPINCSRSSRPVRYLDQRHSLPPDENKNPRGNSYFKAPRTFIERKKRCESIYNVCSLSRVLFYFLFLLKSVWALFSISLTSVILSLLNERKKISLSDNKLNLISRSQPNSPAHRNTTLRYYADNSIKWPETLKESPEIHLAENRLTLMPLVR